MSRFDRMAIVGDADLVFGFRALGIRTFSPRNADEARSVLSGIAQGDWALCLVHQKWLDVWRDQKEEMGKRLFPVVVGFSDHRDLTDRIGKMVRDMAVAATGTDSLVRRKGDNE